MTTMKEFEGFEETFKLYNENQSYEEMTGATISFDSSKELDPISIYNPEEVIEQLSNIAQKQFYFNSLYESQKRVLQTLEDEFEIWFAKKFVEIDSETEIKVDSKGTEIENAIKRNKTQIENLIKVRYENDYKTYIGKIKDEKYRLGIVNSAKKAIESFSYKLHNINDFAKNNKER